jgi:hypothetical protein
VFFIQKIRKITDRSWQKRKPTKACGSGGLPLQKGVGKKRGKKESIAAERKRLTASATFLFIS